MGGLGSGSARQRYATKTDGLLAIDLAQLTRWGLFKAGGHRSGEISWSRGGVKHSRVGYRMNDDAFVLDYRTRRGEADEWRRVIEPVPWRWTDQPLGGQRRWFGCPGCDRRVRVMYGGARFRCRACHGAVYESQYEKFRAPGINAAMRVRDRLGGEAGLCHPFPPKPKGMHWRTYHRLQEADWRAADALDRVLTGLSAREAARR